MIVELSSASEDILSCRVDDSSMITTSLLLCSLLKESNSTENENTLELGGTAKSFFVSNIKKKPI